MKKETKKAKGINKTLLKIWHMKYTKILSLKINKWDKK